MSMAQMIYIALVRFSFGAMVCAFFAKSFVDWIGG